MRKPKSYGQLANHVSGIVVYHFHTNERVLGASGGLLGSKFVQPGDTLNGAVQHTQNSSKNQNFDILVVKTEKSPDAEIFATSHAYMVCRSREIVASVLVALSRPRLRLQWVKA